jgi:hypothetical protein
VLLKPATSSPKLTFTGYFPAPDFLNKGAIFIKAVGGAFLAAKPILLITAELPFLFKAGVKFLYSELMLKQIDFGTDSF